MAYIQEVLSNAELLSNAEKLATVDLVVASYNITWDNGRLSFGHWHQHVLNLEADLRTAIDIYHADLVLLQECGEIEQGLDAKPWLSLLRKICGPDYVATHQSHFTSIVKATVVVLAGPSLQGPLTTWPGHEYRMCQHMKVDLKGNSSGAVDIYSVHSPSSVERPLSATVRHHVLEWFASVASSRALIVGDLDSSVHSLNVSLRGHSDIACLFEDDHMHGDIAIAKGLPTAESLPCEADSTNKAHRMVVVMVPLPVGVALTPNLGQQDWAALAKPGPFQSESNAAKLAPSNGSGSAGKPGPSQSNRSAAKPVHPRPSYPAGNPGPSKSDHSAASLESNPCADDTVAVVSGPSQSQSNAAKLAPPLAQYRDSLPEAPGPSLSKSNAAELAPALESHPLADAMFQAIGELLDTVEAARMLFSDLAELLWTGNLFISSATTGTVSHSHFHASKQRLERMLRKAIEIRQKYQTELYDTQKIADLDFKRPLEKSEMRDLHNQWMNDVGSWLLPCRLEKGFFMCFVGHPCVVTVEDATSLLQELAEVRGREEYSDMLDVSRENTMEVVELNRKRQQTRLALKRGRHDYEQGERTENARLFASGDLQQEVDDAETAYGARKQSGVAMFLGPRMGD